MKIEINLISEGKSPEDVLKEMKEQLMIWSEAGDESRIKTLDHRYSDIFSDRLNGLIITTKQSALSFGEIKELTSELDVRSRNIFFPEPIALDFPESECILSDTISRWRQKWVAGKRPFRTDLREIKKGCRVDVVPKNKFSLYQLEDLIEDVTVMPKVRCLK